MMNEQVENYLATLQRYLKPLPVQEREDTYRFYEELFLDSEMTADQIHAEFGNPKTLARQINANYAMGWNIEDEDETADHNDRPKNKNPWNAVWLIILGVLASPILIPIAIALLVSLMFVVIMLIVMAFIIAGILIALAFAGGMAIVAGISVIGQGFMMALFLIGGGIMLLGLTVLGIPLVIWVVQGIGWVVYRLIKWVGSLTLKRRPELTK
ncbi:MAG: DUF1700 domain-containing protein [Lactobacillaceae bacterium]|jgi:uncharacterized membrane protein|nr:DUF1700 domain-containing protein [Lactobacillaceae bacterium]